VARGLLERERAPLAGPSANRSEHVSATTAAHVLRDLNGRIDAVLDGGRSPVGIESTVVAIEASGARILRRGAISRAQIEELLGPVDEGAPPSGAPAASPGLHRRHYAPAALVRIAPREALRDVIAQLTRSGHRVGVLARGGLDAAEAPVLPLPEDAKGYARDLYASLRELEDRGCSAIAIEAVPDDPAWDAVRDRLARASA
jgi:L-threonylcarbamoyladenylate synthase